MKFRTLIIAALMMSATCTAAHAGWGWSDTLGTYPDAMNFNLLAGVKTMSENDWAPVDDPTYVGFDWDYTRREWPVGITAALLYADKESTTNGLKTSGTTLETHVGLRKIWYSRRQAWFRPYLGAGLTLAYANAQTSGTGPSHDEAGFGLGGWFGGGVFITVYEQFNLGFDIRYSGTPADMNDGTIDAGGLYAGLLIGYHWSDNY